MFHCPVGVWVIEQRAIILSATVRSPTVVVASALSRWFLANLSLAETQAIILIDIAFWPLIQ